MVVKTLLFFAFILFPIKMEAQCLCADMTFQVVLPDLNIKKDKPNYRLDIEEYPYDKTLIWKAPFFKKLTRGDTITFSFPTGAGVDRLIFTIVNSRTHERMTITVDNMHYDNPYFIDLGNFTVGQFHFDWNEIVACQRESPKSVKIQCNGQSFYQLKFKEPETLYVENAIKPIDIYEFYFRD